MSIRKLEIRCDDGYVSKAENQRCADCKHRKRLGSKNRSIRIKCVRGKVSYRVAWDGHCPHWEASE